MNKKVFWTYMFFYTVIIVMILFITIIYALITDLDYPVLLCVMNVILALVVGLILAIMSGKNTRIITQNINEYDLEEFKMYLLKNQFVESAPCEYSWAKYPSFLLKNVKVSWYNQGDKVIINIPYFMRNWVYQQKK